MEDKSIRRWRLEQLLQQQKSKQKISYGQLFEECIEALGEDIIIMSGETSETIRNELTNVYPFTSWGRINWNNTACRHVLISAFDLLPTLKSLNADTELPIYIIWGGTFPVLQTKLQKVLTALDDVLAVDFDTFIYCPSHYVIEFYHEGEITLGLRDLISRIK